MYSTIVLYSLFSDFNAVIIFISCQSLFLIFHIQYYPFTLYIFIENSKVNLISLINLVKALVWVSLGSRSSGVGSSSSHTCFRVSFLKVFCFLSFYSFGIDLFFRKISIVLSPLIFPGIIAGHV